MSRLRHMCGCHLQLLKSISACVAAPSSLSSGSVHAIGPTWKSLVYTYVRASGRASRHASRSVAGMHDAAQLVRTRASSMHSRVHSSLGLLLLARRA